MRFVTDATWDRPGPEDAGRVVLAGSPLRVFRLTAAGAALCERIESGEDVGESSLVTRLIDAGAIHPQPRSSDATFTPADVTVITPQLGGTIRPQRHITVDDGSMPPIGGATIRLEPNRGPGAARNAGRTCATTPLIAFIDADVTFVDPQWLDRLLAHFTDPRVGLVAPRVVGDPTASLDLGKEPARIRAGSRVSYVPAAAIVVRSDAFDDIGGFDEALRFGEDVDFVWRLDQAGWRCRYEPGARVHHDPRSSVVARIRQQVGYGSSAAPLAQRHPRLLAPVHVNRWMAAAWSILGLGHPVIAVALAVANALGTSRRLPDVPRGLVARLTATSYLQGARQVARAVRRAWWPIAVAASLVSKRAQWITIAAIVADPRAAPTDVAYGWGMWREMMRRRTLRPIVPAISSWPPSGRRRPGAAPEHPRGETAR